MDNELLSAILASCATLEAGLLRGRHVADVVLDAERPGCAGSKRADTPLDWLAYRDWLRDAARAAERPTVAATSPGGPADAARIDQLLADAIAETPVAVACSDGVTRYVYPKAYHTLRFLDALDAEVRAIAREWHIAMALAVASDAPLQVTAPLLESECVRRWAWVLTHQGPELPFDEHAAATEPPAWTKTLTAEDWTRFLRAHYAVNGAQLKLIAHAFPPDPDDAGASPLTLAGFLGSLTAENEPGAARRLMRTTSLGQVFATQVTRAASQRDALQRAKRARADAA